MVSKPSPWPAQLQFNVVMDGIEATRRILAEMPVMKILARSIYSDDGFNSGMMRDGALEYMPFLPSDPCARVSLY